MKKRRLLGVFAVVLLVVAMLTMAGCSSDDKDAADDTTAADTADDTTAADTAGETDGEEASEENLRFGFVTKNQTNPIWLETIQGMQDYCDENGIELSVQSTETETEIEQQIQLAQTFLTQEVDAVMIAPLSSVSVVPFIQEANDVDTPVILVETGADEAELERTGAVPTTWVAGNFYEIGIMIGETIVDIMGGEGNIAILEGTAGALPSIDMMEGLTKILDENPGMNVVASQPADFNRNIGYDVTSTILTAHPDLDAIVTLNDEMALGAISALQDFDSESDIIISGMNGIEEAVQSVADGNMIFTISKDSYNIGYTSAKSAHKAVKGEVLEENTFVPSVPITADNAQDFLN